MKSPGNDWYRDTGSGMGATLNTAAGIGGYTLTDRGTWLSFKNRADLAIVAVKTYSLVEIAPAVVRAAETGAVVLPLLNGVEAVGRLAPSASAPL